MTLPPTLAHEPSPRPRTVRERAKLRVRRITAAVAAAATFRGSRPRFPRRVRHRTLRNPSDSDELDYPDHVVLGHRRFLELRLGTIDLDRFDLDRFDLVGELDTGDGFGADVSSAMQFDRRPGLIALERRDGPVALRSMHTIGAITRRW